jgi:predicted RNase H-like HicB family nuclease/uncharacterized damage-inducible protein DinB
MTRYHVYLEIADDGQCFAHVPKLPGCHVRALTREEALRQLPGAIRDYHGWLRSHGEPSPPAGEPIEIEVAGEESGSGPFDPGDTAALFPPEREPISPGEMEEHFRLMAHSRADLLALVSNLSEDLLDWQPNPLALTIRRLLRHVGNAEEWYVSRLVPPETLPAEWEDDEEMPLFEFLEMERRTAVARLRQLTQDERSGVYHPAHYTDHPDEAWTAQKVLRRFLEHEREHTAQVREILDARRRYLLARLAAERGGLMEQLLGLDARVLVEVPVLETWTVKDILAHIAVWDRWEDRAMRCMVGGEMPDFTAVQDIDAANEAFAAEWRDRGLVEVLAELQAARGEWLAWLESLPLEELFRPRSYGGYDWTFSTTALRVLWKHDAEHAGHIATWREAAGLGGKTGPRAILLAALAAAREELLAAAALVPAGERASRPVCGEWTLKDVLGHVADWEWVGVEGMRHMAAGRAPQVEHIADIDAWNQSHAKARRDQPWDVVWADLHAARRDFLEVLGGMEQADLARTFPFHWGEEGTAYQWACVFVSHDREHAQDPRTGNRDL